MIYFSDVDVVLKLARCGFLPCLAELLGVKETEIKVQHLASLKSRTKKLARQEHRRDLEAVRQAWRHQRHLRCSP